MQEQDDLLKENQALRERLSRLSEASLRINESLDLDTVLQEVVDSARALTGSAYGVITTLDDSGLPKDFVTSGMSPEARRALENYLPEGLLVYRYLSALREPLRLDNYGEHIASLGLSDFLPISASSFLTAPIRHGGRAEGNIYLAKSEPGDEFTQEDEETLVMFASHAALVIANARRHQEEQRARADLEALINTSPVGVVVFDATTGVPLSVNREARRIADSLRDPDQSFEELLETLTLRRADGREISLAQSQVAQVLSTGETVRAEEIVVQVPDGRRVSIVINGTPITAADGSIGNVVVTMQDMTPLEEQSRLRAEFLGMVSHELRAPLTSIKGSAATLIGSGASLDQAETHQFHRIIDQHADRMQALITDLLDVARIDAGTLAVSLESCDLAVLVDQARNTFLSGGARHSLQIDLPPDLTRVMADRRRIEQVLGNLLANAARHSSAQYSIRVEAAQRGVQVEVSVADRGTGIAAERLPHLFRRFSRAGNGNQENQAGGSGLGLAISRGIVEAHGGRIWAESEGPGLGARFAFTLPAMEAAGNVAGAGQPQTLGSTARPKLRVLTVDDDPQTLRSVRDALSEAGYAPTGTGDPEAVERLIREVKPHLVLLDLMLPEIDGIGLLEQIPELSEVPVIFLSAYGRDQVIARALEAGADDYIVKPFSSTELVARIQVALRRRGPADRPEPTEPYMLGDLTVNFSERLVSLAGRRLQLTDTEYRVLAELAASAGRVVHHADLLLRVWGPWQSGGSGPVRTVVKNLRSKLGDTAADPTYIFNEPRIGYRLGQHRPA